MSINLTVNINIHWTEIVLVMDIQTISLAQDSLRSLTAAWETHGASDRMRDLHSQITSTVVEYTEVRQYYLHLTKLISKN